MLGDMPACYASLRRTTSALGVVMGGTIFIVLVTFMSAKPVGIRCP